MSSTDARTDVHALQGFDGTAESGHDPTLITDEQYQQTLVINPCSGTNVELRVSKLFNKTLSHLNYWLYLQTGNHLNAPHVHLAPRVLPGTETHALLPPDARRLAWYNILTGSTPKVREPSETLFCPFTFPAKKNPILKHRASCVALAGNKNLATR